MQAQTAVVNPSEVRARCVAGAALSRAASAVKKRQLVVVPVATEELSVEVAMQVVARRDEVVCWPGAAAERV